MNNKIRNWFQKIINKNTIEFEDTSLDKSISEQYDLHRLYMIKKRDYDDYEKQEIKQSFKYVLIIFVCMGIMGFLIYIFSEKDPLLKDFNSLQIGMMYEECRDKLGKNGHLVLEEDNKAKYVWYSVFCNNNECQPIIELEFENGKLVKRSENGLK